MKRYLAIILLLISIPSIAQDTTGVLPKVNVPEGFNWVYILIFFCGMLIHYGVKIFHEIGAKGFFPGLVNNFVGWFINKFHYTLIAGAAAAILALVETYGLNIGFSAINLIGTFASLVAGYIGDSAFNAGVIIKPEAQ